MITTILCLYALGVGICGTLCIVHDILISGVGQAFGWGSRGTPLWQIILLSLVWPGFIGYLLMRKFLNWFTRRN